MKKVITKFLILMFCISLILPDTARADERARDELLERTLELQERTMTSDYSQPFSGKILFSLEGKTLQKEGFEKISLTVNFKVDSKQEILALNFLGKVTGEQEANLNLMAWIHQNKIIIPRETLEGINELEEQETDLDDRINFVYLENQDFNFDELVRVFAFQEEQRKAANELVEVLFTVMPAEYFKFNNDLVIFKLDKQGWLKIFNKILEPEFMDTLEKSLQTFEQNLFKDFSDMDSQPESTDIKEKELEEARKTLNAIIDEYFDSLNLTEIMGKNIAYSSFSFKIKDATPATKFIYGIGVGRNAWGKGESYWGKSVGARAGFRLFYNDSVSTDMAALLLKTYYTISQDRQIMSIYFDFNGCIDKEIHSLQAMFKFNMKLTSDTELSLPELTEGNSIDINNLSERSQVEVYTEF